MNKEIERGCLCIVVNTTHGNNEGKCVTALKPINAIEFTYPDGHTETHNSWIVDIPLITRFGNTTEVPEYMLFRIDGGDFTDDKAEESKPLALSKV